ncbi:hypothetical protein ERJ70_11270 [Sediminibacillus dalangtanensis]|uniref:Uncharacterized protein n=1 Tax=Sediminibacillus dalangtanensis TaxID=2729421 RepID=A0ABX7VSA6_9BACI|nr:hypothetical protein [Sediminibacillus dalangtanensis]QTM99827.1 hypothetical protein ERJ70_11270 [Sediminibacillus dalangtanensis]
MKKTLLIPVILTAAVLAAGLFFLANKETTVLKYFPLDEKISFSSYHTKLKILSEIDTDEYGVQWQEVSELETPIYLRQDVSLLYVDGKLKGILSKWKENGQTIEQKSSIHGEDSSHFQAITFHHGEIHYPDDKIKSIQAMSSDELYVIDSPHTALESFDQPLNKNQEEWKHTLDTATSQQLSFHWNQLINHFNIPIDRYTIVPLTDLAKYENLPLPGLTETESQQVIGQLWEGLYKHYILGIAGSQNNKHPINTFIPLLLFANDGSHLMVLYQDENEEKQQLLQAYPSFDDKR